MTTAPVEIRLEEGIASASFSVPSGAMMER